MRYPKSNSTKDIMIEYLNDPTVISNLHVTKSTKEIKFAPSNNTVHVNFNGDQMIDRIAEHQKILDNNITLVLFYGQFDLRDGPYGAQEWLRKMKWDGMDGFNAASRNTYHYISDDNQEIRLGGNFRSYKNFHFLVIYSAGHLVPATQLACSRSMLSDIISDDKLLCHKKDGMCSLDNTTLSLMNNCTNNGQGVNGKCICNTGFYGADCSITTKSLKSDDIHLSATTWKYLKIDKDKNIEIKVSSSSGNDFILYTRKGNVPSQSFYDSYYKGTSYQGHISKGSTGEYIALFNPNLDKSIHITVSIPSEENINSVALWICVAMAALFVCTAAINIISYVCSKKRSKMIEDDTAMKRSKKQSTTSNPQPNQSLGKGQYSNIDNDATLADSNV